MIRDDRRRFKEIWITLWLRSGRSIGAPITIPTIKLPVRPGCIEWTKPELDDHGDPLEINRRSVSALGDLGEAYGAQPVSEMKALSLTKLNTSGGRPNIPNSKCL